MVASTSAPKPSHCASEPSPSPVATSAPTMVMPEMALEPDISGVCNWAGTLEMSSNPRKTASVKVKRRRMSSMVGCSQSF